MKKIIAIDAGWNGAIAWYDEKTGDYDAEPCPGDCHGMIQLLKEIKEDYGKRDWAVLIEANNASPHFGARGNFGLGHNIGSWEASLSSLDLPWENVSPKDWQKVCSKEKSRSKKGRKMKKEKAWLLARRRYSDLREDLGDKVPSIKSKAQGVADALCILDWKRRKEGI